jgi:hypothetical protein
MISGDLRLVACCAARTLGCSTVLLATSIPQESKAQGATSRGNETTHVAITAGEDLFRSRRSTPMVTVAPSTRSVRMFPRSAWCRREAAAPAASGLHFVRRT